MKKWRFLHKITSYSRQSLILIFIVCLEHTKRLDRNIWSESWLPLPLTLPPESKASVVDVEFHHHPNLISSAAKKPPQLINNVISITLFLIFFSPHLAFNYVCNKPLIGQKLMSQIDLPNAIGLWAICNAFLCPSTVLLKHKCHLFLNIIFSNSQVLL